MKDKEYLYVDSEAHTEDSDRIVRLPNNTLIIYNASLDDSSNNYQCIILLKEHIVLTHRLRVEPKGRSIAIPQQPVAPQQSTVPPQPAVSPQHSHRGLIRVTPKRRIEVNQGHNITFGCETSIQPPPEIKWFVEVQHINKANENISIATIVVSYFIVKSDTNYV